MVNLSKTEVEKIIVSIEEERENTTTTEVLIKAIIDSGTQIARNVLNILGENFTEKDFLRTLEDESINFSNDLFKGFNLGQGGDEDPLKILNSY